MGRDATTGPGPLRRRLQCVLLVLAAAAVAGVSVWLLMSRSPAEVADTQGSQSRSPAAVADTQGGQSRPVTGWTRIADPTGTTSQTLGMEPRAAASDSVDFDATIWVVGAGDPTTLLSSGGPFQDESLPSEPKTGLHDVVFGGSGSLRRLTAVGDRGTILTAELGNWNFPEYPALPKWRRDDAGVELTPGGGQENLRAVTYLLLGMGTSWECAVGSDGVILTRQDETQWVAHQPDGALARTVFLGVCATLTWPTDTSGGRLVTWVVGEDGAVLRSSSATTGIGNRPDMDEDGGGAGWVQQDQVAAVLGPDATVTLTDVVFADPDHGWIIGDRGTLLATVDGGRTWTRQEAHTTNRLNEAFFADAKAGWIVGDGGTILATTDGGASWRRQKADPGVSRDFVTLAPANRRLYAFTSDGYVFMSADVYRLLKGRSSGTDGYFVSD